MMRRSLKLIFILHGLVTLAASVVLVIQPDMIPLQAGVPISKSEYLLCYFLAAAELTIAYFSFAAIRFTEKLAIRSVLTGFIVFHLGTALLEVVVYKSSHAQALIINIAVRVIVIIAFVAAGSGYFGRGVKP